MLIAIHRGADSQDDHADGWAECLKARGADVRWIDLTAQDALHQVQGCDGVLWRWNHPSDQHKVCRIIDVIELYLGLPVFPNHSSYLYHRDKLAQYHLFQAAGVPMPQTWIFWDKQKAIEWALQTDYPKIFKSSSGISGLDVVLLSSFQEARGLIERMFGQGIYSGQIEHHLKEGRPRNWPKLRALAGRYKAAARYLSLGLPPSRQCPEQGYVYFQELVPGNDYKTWIRVIGDRAFGILRFNRPNDFRSYSDKYDDNPSHVDLRCVEIAFDISERLGFPIMGYDFLLNRGEPVVLETTMQYPETRCGYWKRNLEWVSEPISPQEALVEAFLHRIRSGNRKSGTISERAHLFGVFEQNDARCDRDSEGWCELR